MELAIYIEETLVQIAEGVNGAINRLGSIGALVNPITQEGTSGEIVAQAHNPGERMVQKVEFNILVTVEKIEGKNGRISVGSSVFGAGRDKAESEQSKHTNTLKFTIPIALVARR